MLIVMETSVHLYAAQSNFHLNQVNTATPKETVSGVQYRVIKSLNDMVKEVANLIKH